MESEISNPKSLNAKIVINPIPAQDIHIENLFSNPFPFRDSNKRALIAFRNVAILFSSFNLKIDSRDDSRLTNNGRPDKWWKWHRGILFKVENILDGVKIILEMERYGK